jgi:hypothetical protein
MVPMKMGKEQVDRGGLLGCNDFLSQVTYPCTSIENESAKFVRLNLNARCITPDCGEKVFRQSSKE